MESTFDHITETNQCLRSLPQGGCGDDLFYSDDFEIIKTEMEKLSGCDYAMVIERCCQLLGQETKDMRLAGYLCLALTVLQKDEGLLTGLEIYRSLLKEHNLALHPSREKAKHAAIQWLNQDKLKHLLPMETIPHDRHQVLRKSIDEFNQTLSSIFGSDIPQFNVLDEWLSSIPKPNPLKPTQTKSQEISQAKTIIEDQEQAIKTQLKLIQFWHQEQEWLLASQLSRALKWHNVTLPPDNLLPAPRKEALKQIEKAEQKGQWETVIAMGEPLFIEPSGHYALDLQVKLYKAGTALGLDVYAKFIQHATIAFLHQHPELKQLRFSNDDPFIRIESIKVLTENACDKKEKKLSKKEEKISHLHTHARHQVKEHNHELAGIYFQSLLEEIETSGFANWFPEEANRMFQEMLTHHENHGHLIFPNDQQKEIKVTLLRKMHLLGS